MKTISKGNIFLILAAIVWGMGLVSQQAGMDYLGPLSFTAVRCTLGGISMIPLVVVLSKNKARAREQQINQQAAGQQELSQQATVQQELNKPTDNEAKGLVKAAFFCAIPLLSLILLQQYGLLHTSVGKAGFITALYILITPVSGKFLLHKPVARNTWVGVAIALVGMYFLCLTDGIDGINIGDVIMIFAAIASSAHMHTVDHFVAKYDPVKLSCYQFIMVGLMCVIPAFVFESDVFTWEYIKLSAIPILYAGLASCAVGYTFQIIGQKYTEPNTASLLLSMETVFALLTGWIILGEVLAVREYIGCAIMFIAIIIAQLPDRKTRQN